MIDTANWTKEAVFAKVRDRALQGVMLHGQMRQAFEFLGLAGFKYVHACSEIDEAEMLQELDKYYIKNHNKMIAKPENGIKIDVIPVQFYSLTNRNEIAPDYKKQFTKTMLEEWKKWEQESKELYEAAAQFCFDEQCSLDGKKFVHMAKGCQHAVKKATKILSRLSDMGFEMSAIYHENDWLKMKYKEKLCKQEAYRFYEHKHHHKK